MEIQIRCPDIQAVKKLVRPKSGVSKPCSLGRSEKPEPGLLRLSDGLSAVTVSDFVV